MRTVGMIEKTEEKPKRVRGGAAALKKTTKKDGDCDETKKSDV